MLVPFSCQALVDEIEKIAASKWRQMLRAGGIGAEDVARLQSARRPGGGALLDYAREIAGVDTGTRALARKYKIPFFERDPSATRESALQALRQGNLREAARTGAKALEGKAVQKATRHTGGGLSLGGVVAVDPNNAAVRIARDQAAARGAQLSQQDIDAMNAMVRRHEVREAVEIKKRLFPQLKPKALLEQAALLRKPKRVGWIVPSADPTADLSSIQDPAMRDKVRQYIRLTREKNKALRAQHMQGAKAVVDVNKSMADVGGRVGKRISDIGRKAKAKGIPMAGRVQSAGSKMQANAAYSPEFARKHMEASAPASATGAATIGQHLSPAPVLEESYLSPMMPGAAQRSMRSMRELGEVPLLKRYGIEYGVAPTPQQTRRVMSEWSRFNV